jgi:hypothetical protein
MQEIVRAAERIDERAERVRERVGVLAGQAGGPAPFQSAPGARGPPRTRGRRVGRTAIDGDAVPALDQADAEFLDDPLDAPDGGGRP